MKIGICDDVVSICDKIEDILDAYDGKNNFGIEIFQFTSINSVKEFLKKDSLDLLFLDIEFPNNSGIDLAKFIREDKINYQTEIIFISGSDNYYRDLLNFQPIFFISKPFTESNIIEGLEIFLARLNLLNMKFTYTNNAVTKLVLYNNIFYFSSEGKKINIHLENKSDSYYGKFFQLENELKNSNFFRIHKSFIVNFDKISSIMKNSVVLINGVELPIGRKYKKEFEEFILTRS